MEHYYNQAITGIKKMLMKTQNFKVLIRVIYNWPDQHQNPGYLMAVKSPWPQERKYHYINLIQEQARIQCPTWALNVSLPFRHVCNINNNILLGWGERRKRH